MEDLISRQAAIEAHCELCTDKATCNCDICPDVEVFCLLPPELPSYVEEIEAEFKKAVNVPYVRKPLAKALYEVWKKHDREDAERRENG